MLLLRNELEGAADSTCKLMRRKSAIYSVRDFVVKSDDGRKGKKRSSINNLSRCLISGSLLEKELLDPVYPLYVNLEVNLQYPHQLEGCILMAKDMEESEKFTKEQCCEAYARVFSSFMCKNQLYDLDFTNMHRNPLYMFVTSSTAHAVQLFCNFYQDLSQHLADQKSLLSDEELLYLTQSCEEAMCYFLRTKFPPKEGYKRYHALTRNSQDRFQRVLGWLSKSFERPGSSLPRPSSCPLVPNQNGENRLVVDYGPLLRRVGCLDELVATDSKPAPHAQLDFDAAAQANTVTEEKAEESAAAQEGKGRHEQIVDIYSGEEALPTQQQEEEEDEDNAGDERPVDDSDGEQEDVDVDDAHAEREDEFTEMPNRQYQEQVEDGYVKAGEDIDVEDNIEQGHLETLDDQDVEAGIDEQDSGEVDPNGKFDYQQDPERTVDEDRPEEEEVEQEGNLSDYNESQQEQLEEDVIMPTRNNINREQGESFEASDSLQMLENYRAVSTEQEGEVNDGYHMTALDTNEEFFDASQGGDISRQNRGEEEDEGEFFEAQEFGKDGEVYNDTGGDHACVGAMSKGDKQTVEPGAGEGGQDTEDPQCNQHDEDVEGFYASDVVAGETEHVGHDEREKENETEDDREESTYGGAGNEGGQEAIVEAKVIEVEPMETSEVERGETNVSVEANSVDDATSLPRQKLMRDDEQIREDKPSLGLGPPLQGDSADHDGRGGGDFLHTDAPAHVASPPSDSPRSRGTERRHSPCQESEPKEDVRMAASLDDDGLSESVKSCGQVDENSTAERKGSSHSRDDQDGGDKDVDEGYAAEEEDYNFAPHKSSGVGPSYDSASQEDTSSLVASQKDTTLLQVADTAHHPQILVNSEEAASGAAVAEVPLDFAYDATGEESQGQTEEEEDHHKGRGMAISDVISTNVARLPAVAHEPSVDGYDAEESQGHTEEDEERPSEKARSAEVETERSNAFDEQKGPTGKSLNIGDGYDATAEEESQGHTEDEEDRPSGDLPVSLDAQGCTLDDQQDQRPTVERHVEFAPSREVASTKVDEGYDPDDAQDHTEDEVPQNRVDGYQGGESSLDQTEDEGVPTDIEDEEAKLQPDQNRSNETHRAQDGFVQQDAQSISGMSAADDHPTGKHDVESSEQEEVVEKKRVQSGPGSFQQPRSKLQDYAAAAQQRFAATEQQLTPEKNLPRNSEDGKGPIPSEYRSPESEQKANISIEEPVKVATKVESVVGDAIMVETFVGSDQRNNDTREGVEMDVERAGVEDQEETEGVKVDVTHSTPNCSFELEARSPRTTMSGSGDMDIDSLPNARDEIEEVSCSKMAVELGYDSLLQTRETGQPTGSVDAEVSNPAPSSVDVPVVTNKVDTAFMSSTNTAMDCDDHNSSKVDEDTDHARQGDVTPPSDSPSNKALSLRFEQESDVHPEVRSQHVDDKNTADGLAKPLLESRSSEDVQKVDTIKISDGDEVAPAAEMRSNERVGRIDDRSSANGDEFEPVNDCITSDGNGVKPTSENPPNEDVGEVENKNNADGNEAEPAAPTVDVGNLDDKNNTDGDGAELAAESRAPGDVEELKDSSTAGGKEVAVGNLDDKNSADGDGAEPAAESWPAEDVEELEDSNTAGGNEVDVGNLDDKNNADGDGAEPAARESRLPDDVEELEDSNTAGGKEVDAGNLDDKNNADGDGGELAAESRAPGAIEELEGSNTGDGKEVDVGNLDDKNNADGDGAEPAARGSRLPDDVEELEDSNTAGGKEVDVGNLDDKNNADGDGGELAAESRAPGDVEELEDSSTAGGKEVDVGNLDDKNNADGDGAEPAARESRLPDDVEELEDSNTAGGKEVDVGNLDDKNNADGVGVELAAESRTPGDVEELEDSNTAGGKEVDVGNLNDKNNADRDGAELAARESRLTEDVEELEDRNRAGGKEVDVGNLDDKNSADGDGAEPAAESRPAEDVEELEDSNTAGGNEVDVGNLDDKNNADGDGAEPAARESRLPDDVEELEDSNTAGGKEVDVGNLDDKNNADGDGGELAAESRAPGAVEELDDSSTAGGKEVDVGNLDDKNSADGDGAEPAAESRAPGDVEELEDSNTAGGKEVDVGNLDDKNSADGDGAEPAAESRPAEDVEELEDSNTAGGKEVDVGKLDDKNNTDGDGAELAAESRAPGEVEELEDSNTAGGKEVDVGNLDDKNNADGDGAELAAESRAPGEVEELEDSSTAGGKEVDVGNLDDKNNADGDGAELAAESRAPGDVEELEDSSTAGGKEVDVGNLDDKNSADGDGVELAAESRPTEYVEELDDNSATDGDDGNMTMEGRPNEDVENLDNAKNTSDRDDVKSSAGSLLIEGQLATEIEKLDYEEANKAVDSLSYEHEAFGADIETDDKETADGHDVTQTAESLSNEEFGLGTEIEKVDAKETADGNEVEPGGESLSNEGVVVVDGSSPEAGGEGVVVGRQGDDSLGVGSVLEPIPEDEQAPVSASIGPGRLTRKRGRAAGALDSIHAERTAADKQQGAPVRMSRKRTRSAGGASDTEAVTLETKKAARDISSDTETIFSRGRSGRKKVGAPEELTVAPSVGASASKRPTRRSKRTKSSDEDSADESSFEAVIAGRPTEGRGEELSTKQSAYAKRPRKGNRKSGGERDDLGDSRDSTTMKPSRRQTRRSAQQKDQDDDVLSATRNASFDVEGDDRSVGSSASMSRSRRSAGSTRSAPETAATPDRNEGLSTAVTARTEKTQPRGRSEQKTEEEEDDDEEIVDSMTRTRRSTRSADRPSKKTTAKNHLDEDEQSVASTASVSKNTRSSNKTTAKNHLDEDEQSVASTASVSKNTRSSKKTTAKNHRDEDEQSISSRNTRSTRATKSTSKRTTTKNPGAEDDDSVASTVSRTKPSKARSTDGISAPLEQKKKASSASTVSARSTRSAAQQHTRKSTRHSAKQK